MGRSNDSTQRRSSFKDARVRDRRRVSWFSVDNEVLDNFGPRIGLHGFAVYCALSRHAHVGDEEANVSLTELCKHLKMGRAKLLQTLNELRDVGLIAIDRGDRKTTNTYTLLEVPKAGSEENQGSSAQNHHPGSEQNHYKTIESKTNQKVLSAKGSAKEKEGARRREGYEWLFDDEG